MLVDEEQNKHIYVTIGHRISLSTATKITLKLLDRSGPLPLVIVDRNSRKKIKRMNEDDYKNAKSWEMIYLLE